MTQKIVDLDLDGYTFECAECGKCCYRAVIPVPVGLPMDGYSHNYKGELVRNPKTTVALFYTEKPRMEQIIKNRYQIEPKFYPQITLYSKDFPVGFIMIYQIATIGKSCMFYDAEKRKCKIYTARPLSCQTYPLMLNMSREIVPELAVDCTAFENELKKRVKNLSDDPQIIFKLQNSNPKVVLFKAFPTQYEIYLQKTVRNLRKTKIFLRETKGLWLSPDEVTPERVKGHRLLDLSQFFSWARKNLNNNINIDTILHQMKNTDKEKIP